MKIAFLFHFSPYLLVVVHTAPHTFSRLLPKFLTASKSFLIFSCSKVAYAKLLFSKKTHLKILKTNKYLHINRVSRQFFFDSYFFYSNVLEILFSSNHNIHKSSSGLYFWASDPLIERFL